MNADMIEITGYEQDGWCEHCGRKLRHCIRISDGRIVGAYANVLDDDYAKSIALRSINLLEGIEYKLDARRQLEELERSK